MALANFFEKITLGISQILKGYNPSQMEAALNSQRIGIFFDENGANSKEGRSTLDLVIRLVARLFPVIQIECSHSNQLVDDLKLLAKSINPVIEITESERPTVCIVVGKTAYSRSTDVFYLGSDNWIIGFSNSIPVGSSDSINPLGAGAAACIGMANLFRYTFKEQLSYGTLDQDFSLSLLDYSLPASKNNLRLEKVNLGESVVVGLGAVGNSFIWAISQMPLISGNLIIIDPEKVSISNLQRYVLAKQSDIGINKTDLCSVALKESRLSIQSEGASWGEFINKRKEWDIQTLVTCVDNIKDRIMMQGALPKKIFNAWTQPENLGVSRHIDFVEKPCLCCLYFPTVKKTSRSQEVADNLNLSNQEKIIRDYLANNKPVDEGLLHIIATANKVSVDYFLQYIGKSLDVFYSEVVCGGVLLKFNNSLSQQAGESIAVPSAFESAFAGILLAAELIKDKLNFPVTDFSVTTQFNLLRPLTKYLNIPETKRSFCICSDSIFLQQYKTKWAE
ncbi:MAG: E2 ligase fold family C protein [Chitinophagales bacterium]|nr:E2 ligase fold family C protein [Chitinophagales bacterium]